MFKSIWISIILLNFACCCHLHELLSSYFTFSNLKQPREGSQGIGELHADTEVACALRCNRNENCDNAIFHIALRKCSLYEKKDKCSRDPDVEENDEMSRIQTMTKVRNFITVNNVITYENTNLLLP